MLNMINVQMYSGKVLFSFLKKKSSLLYGLYQGNLDFFAGELFGMLVFMHI